MQQFLPYGAAFEPGAVGDEVGPRERGQAESWLLAALLDGALPQHEYDWRVREVREATTRAELDAIFVDLAGLQRRTAPVEVATPSEPVMHTWAAGATHASLFFFGPLVPGLVWATARRGSWLRVQAARALSWWVYAMAGLVAAMVLDVPGVVLGLGWLGFVALTCLGAVRTGQGRDWRYPLVGRLPQVVKER